MKKIKLPFSLDEYNKGYYELKCGNKEARIITTDINSDKIGYIVCAIKNKDGKETIKGFREDGRYYIEKNKKYDLFLVKKQFKDGDILSNGHNTILVYNGVTRSGLPKHDIVLTKCVLCFGILNYRITGEAWDSGFGVDEFKLANDSEKKTLFKELYKNNVYWNDEKKVIEINMEHEFHEFEKVIVRDSNDAKWKADFFSHIDETNNFPFICVGCSYKHCLHYNEYTKHLIGTTLND